VIIILALPTGLMGVLKRRQIVDDVADGPKALAIDAARGAP
jgi:hypothetical protein